MRACRWRPSESSFGRWADKARSSCRGSGPAVVGRSPSRATRKAVLESLPLWPQSSPGPHTSRREAASPGVSRTRMDVIMDVIVDVIVDVIMAMIMDVISRRDSLST